MADRYTTATLGLGIDAKQFNKELGNTTLRTQAAFESMKRSADAFSAKWHDLTAGIKDTKRIISGILISQGFYALSNALLDSGNAALSFSKNMETAAISLEYFVKGSDKANKSLAFLREMNKFAARTPFTTEDVLTFSKYMQAVGVSMGTTKSFLQVITDTAAATGATDENLQRIVFGLGQMKTKGRIANEEIRQLANANIPIYEILQEELKLTGEQISNIGKNWIPAEKAIVAILTGLEKRYAGAADRIANTMTGMADTIADNAKIISQVVGENLYNALAENMARLRDLLDRYREVATEKGAMGLFTTILTDIDASGQIGTEILTLIGNIKQLIAAILDLYNAAKPALRVLGDAFYSTLTAVSITLTSFSRALEAGLGLLEKFGITSGKTADVLASLFITYQVAKWMGTLGQAVTSAAYSMITLAQSALQAHSGLTVVMGGLAGLVSAGLAAYGVFRMLNSAMAGFDTSISGTNVLPDSYSKAYAEYEREMQSYNEKIAQYQKDFLQPYTAIDEGNQQAVDGFDDLKEASKSAAASVKNDWVAAFDEVYTIPTEAGGAFKEIAALADLFDFSALMPWPSFKFPALKAEELVKPVFEWQKVYTDSILDSDVMDGDWWKALLPVVIAGGAIQLGNIFAKTVKGTKPDGDGGGAGSTTAFQSEATARQSLKEATKRFTEHESILKQMLDKLSKGTFKTDLEREGYIKLLEERVLEVEKEIERLNKLARISGNYDKKIVSAVLDEAQNKLTFLKIEHYTAQLAKLQKEAKTPETVDKILKEQKTLKGEITKLYEGYIARTGSTTPDLENLVKNYISTRGLEDRINMLIKETVDVKGLLLDNKYDAVSLRTRIEELNKLSAGVEKELAAIGADLNLASIHKNTADMRRLLQLQLQRTRLQAQKADLQEFLDTALVRNATGFETTAVAETISNINKTLQSIDKRISATIAGLSVGTEEERVVFRELQQRLVASNRFNNLLHGLVDRHLPEIARFIKSLEKYGRDLLVNYTEGQAHFKQGIDRIQLLANQLGGQEYTKSLRFFFSNLADKLYDEVYGKGALGKQFELFGDTFADIVREFGTQSNVQTDVIENYISSINTLLSKPEIRDPVYNTLELVIKQLVELEARRHRELTPSADRSLLDVFDDELEKISNNVKSLKEFDKEAEKIYRELQKLFPEQVSLSRKEFKEQAAITRELLEERFKLIAAEQKIQSSRLNRVSKDTAELRQLKALADVLKPITEISYGGGIRRGWATAELFAGEIFELSKIFDPERIALSGGDIAAIFGHSSYGQTVMSTIISNLTEQQRLLLGISDNIYTLRSLANMYSGAIAEIPILSATAEMVRPYGYYLAAGDVFFNTTRRLQTQLDALLFTERGQLRAPLDAKAFGSFENKLLPVLKEIAISPRWGQGTWVIPARGFEIFAKTLDDVAWQLAAQATVLDTKFAWLSVLDTKAAGITEVDKTHLHGLDPLKAADRATLRRIVEQEQAPKYLQHLRDIKQNTHLIRIEIPKWAKETVIELADKFYDLQKLIAEKYYYEKIPLRELVAQRNMLGDILGQVSHVRYIAPPKLSIPAVNSILRDILTQVTSTNKGVQEIGLSRLDDIIERINDAAYNNTGSLEQRIVDLGETITGQRITISGSGEQFIDIANELKQYRETLNARLVGLTTVLSDEIKQFNQLVLKDKGFKDTYGINQRTVADLAHSIIATDKQLTGGSAISTQLYSMLSGGKPMTLTSNVGFADIPAYMQYISQLSGTKALTNAIKPTALSTLPEKATSIVPAYIFDMLFAGIGFKDFYKTLYENLSMEEKLEVDKLYIQAQTYASWRQEDPLERLFGASTPGIYMVSKGTGYGLQITDIPRTSELFEEKIVKPLEQFVEVQNARTSGFVLDRYFGGIFQKLFNNVIGKASTEKLAQTVQIGSPYFEKAATLYSYGLTSPIERLVRMELEKQGATAPVSRATAMQYETSLLNKFRYPSNAEYSRFIDRFLNENKTAFERITALNKIAADKYSKDFEYMTYLFEYATTAKDVAVREQLRPYVEKSDLASIFGMIDISKIRGDLEQYVAMLNELNKTDLTVDDYVSNNQISMLIDSMNNFIRDSSKSMFNRLEAYKQASGYPYKEAYVASLAQWRGSDKAASEAAERLYSSLSSADKDVLNALRSEYGIETGLIRRSFTDSYGEEIKELFGTVSIDTDKLYDNLIGWTLKLPQAISLDGSILSANDVEVLAQAGIQINGDGSVTFMKAMNEDISGTTRSLEITAKDLSKSMRESLELGGISFSFVDDLADVTLDVETLSGQMERALFRLPANIARKLNTDMEAALDGLGTVTADGFFMLTNSAILSGEQTIEGFLNGLNKVDKGEISDTVWEALAAIDDVIAQGGERTAQTIATWADGIIIPSPISAADLTPELEAEFAKYGIAFAYEGDRFMALINRLGNQWKDGITLIPEETWDTLNENVLRALEFLGVSVTRKAGFVQVDISNTLSRLVDVSEIDPAIRAAMEDLGLTLEISSGKIVGIVGQAIEDGIATIPQSVWDAAIAAKPDLVSALSQLDITMTQTSEGMMLDMNSIVASGIGDIIALFTEQPDFWNQIPEALQQLFIDAGITTQEGILVIDTTISDLLIPIGDNWAGFWEQLPEDVRTTFEQAGIDTSDGLFKIEQYLNESQIPAGVDHLILAFNELPPEIQAVLEASGDAVSDNSYLVYNATEDTMLGMKDIISTKGGEAVSEAETIAANIAQAVAQALADIKGLERAQAAANPFIFTKYTVGNPQTMSVAGGNYKVYPRYNSSGSLNGYVIESLTTGRVHAVTTKEYQEFLRTGRYATGGIADGLSLTGELGRELAITPDGKLHMLGARGAQLIDLPKNTRILSNADTEEILKYLGPIEQTRVSKLASGNFELDDMTTSGLYTAASMHNAGISLPEVMQPVYQQPSSALLAKQVLEEVLPMLVQSTQQADTRIPVYVHTLVADERGLKELERKLAIHRVKEARRG